MRIVIEVGKGKVIGINTKTLNCIGALFDG